MLRGTLVMFAVLLAAASAACSQNPLSRALASHVDENVPDAQEFDAILKRDITAYMTDSADKDISVSVELLRDRPTQSGVALPKFYIWIEKRNASGRLMESAAARIAAIEKKRFDVVQYYDRKRILAEPELMQKVFPDDVYEKILKKAQSSEK